MKNLWAPWRFPWILESLDQVTDCFICDALQADSDKDRDNLVLLRCERTLLMMNRYPYSNGHLLVCLNRHINDLCDLEPAEWEEVGFLTQQSIEAISRTLNPHGFNIGWNIGRISGAGLEHHVHQHIVPRWSGDTNFMPVVGQTKVLSQDLWECYDQLSEALTRQ